MYNPQSKPESALLDRDSSLDLAYLQLLEIIGWIDESQNIGKLADAKGRIFWKTIREIADQKLNTDKEMFNPTLRIVLASFPDEKMKTDGRMWLPMHFAMCVPNMDIDDIQTLVDNYPDMIKQDSGEDLKFTPGHLAVMVKKPNMALIERLKVYDPSFGVAKTSQQSTPLHLAAQYSNSVAVIEELIRAYPPALKMKNDERDEDGEVDQMMPLHSSLHNSTAAAPDILQAIVDAYPQAVNDIDNIGRLPLHYCLEYSANELPSKEKMVSILLKAFPGAVDIHDNDLEILPIHYAAEYCETNILQMIADANPAHLTAMNDNESLAHFAVNSGKISNLRYIHSKVPEQLMSIDHKNCTPLRRAIEDYYDNNFIEAVASLAPEAVLIRDTDGNNLLHIWVEMEKPQTRQDTLLRLLIRLIPRGALAVNYDGQTPYDILNPNDPGNNTARRLLLLAGAPSLHPETRQQMNYQARKGALFAFFAPRGGEHHSGGEGLDICRRIRHGAGAMEIIRQIVSFL